MRILVSHNAGFCWGVRRAMDTALETSARFGHQGPVQTMGPLIHNPQALEHLSQRGVAPVETVSELRSGSVIIRAHGIPLPEFRTLKSFQTSGRLRVFNATCPEVAKVQAAIRRHAAKGGFTIILGSADHAEVMAHRSYATAGHQVIDNLEGALSLPQSSLPRALVVAQTTFEIRLFHEITRLLRSRCPSLQIKNTICRDTWKRQEESRQLVQSVDQVVVVGGKASNNTRHLAEVAAQAGKATQWVEGPSELNLERLKSARSIGVLAGASTPTWIVQEVVDYLEQLNPACQFKRLWKQAKTRQMPFLLGLTLASVLYNLNSPVGGLRMAAMALLPAVFYFTIFERVLCQKQRVFKVPDRRDALRNSAQRHDQGSRAPLWTANGALLLLAAMLGPRAFLLAAAFCLASFLATFPPLRNAFLRMPAIKDFSLALAGPMLILSLSLAQQSGRPPVPSILWGACLFLFGLAYHAGKAIRDFRQDHLVGKESLLIAIGLANTRRVIAACLLSGLFLLLRPWFVAFGMH